MGSETNIRNGLLIQRVFEVLLDYPKGLTIKEVLERIEKPDWADKSETRFFEEVMSGCIPPIKAGWLTNKGYYLAVSNAGKLAFERYPDPAEFMKEATKHSSKAWLSYHFPRPYYVAGKAKDQIVSEYRAARRIGVRHLLGRIVRKPDGWRDVLPVQSPRRVTIPGASFNDWDSLLQYFSAEGITYYEGGHAAYLPPQSFQSSIFNAVSSFYPANAGLKIIKEAGGIEDSRYVSVVSKGDSRLHLKLAHGHKQLTLVANLLYTEGIGPRLFDLIELQCGQQLWTAYVVEEVEGGTPSMAACEAGVSRLRELDAKGLLRVAHTEGFDDIEFQCPDCEKNALMTVAGEFKYIDFQNFFLAAYGSYLKGVALDATEASHFGDKSVLRGGRYLYQTVPGVDLPAKRNVADRVQVLQRLMTTAGVSVQDRVVLDIGCNIGMMMAQYLSLGAKWCHGWDRARVTPHTEKLLLALGCTRFSTSSADIVHSQDLEGDLPSFVRSNLSDCVISYLAVRGHIGWIEALRRIPWEFLIYEGHEGETREDFQDYISELRQAISFEVSAMEDYVDGDSEQRTLAILRRST